MAYDDDDDDDAETSLLAINFMNCFQTSNKLVITILRNYLAEISSR